MWTGRSDGIDLNLGDAVPAFGIFKLITIQIMKLRMIMAAGVLVAMAASCAKENNIKVVLPPDVAELSGVEAMYERGLHEYLEIAPTVNFVNYTEENKDSVKYEWNIDYKVVGTDSVLTFKCDKNGQFNGYLKVSTSTGAKIADFKLTVTTPYDKGILLLSGTGEGSMLTWKRLDIMATPASPYAFKDNNPTLELGKSPLALCWKGEGITSPKAAQLTDNYYEVLVSTENPVKVYALNTNDMTVRTEITYNGSGEFHPNAMLCPKGTQEGVWNNMQDVVYFVGGGRDYIMTSDRNSSPPKAQMFFLPGQRLQTILALSARPMQVIMSEHISIRQPINSSIIRH